MAESRNSHCSPKAAVRQPEAQLCGDNADRQSSPSHSAASFIDSLNVGSWLAALAYQGMGVVRQAIAMCEHHALKRPGEQPVDAGAGALAGAIGHPQ
jgi:hypothetical protein